MKLLRSLEDELSGVALRLVLFPISRVLVGSPARTQPRALAQAPALAGCGWREKLLQPPNIWNDAEWVGLLGTGQLNNLGSLALPYALPSTLLNGQALPQCANSTGDSGTPASTELLVQVAGTSEAVALVADLWALDSSGSGVAPAALGRGLARDGSWLLYRPGFPAAAAAAAALYANMSALQAAAGGAGSAAALSWDAGFGLPTGAQLPAAVAPTSTLLPPCGLSLSPLSIAWTAMGVPAGVDWAGASPSLHVVSGASPSGALSFSIPAGTLRPGWVYRVAATASLRAAWSWDCVPQPWGAASGGSAAGVGGGGASASAFDVAAASAVPLTAPGARAAPLLFIHTPPSGGTISISPDAAGSALLTQFAVGALPAQWEDSDGGLLAAGRPSTAVAAARAYAAALPMPPASAAQLWVAAATSSSAWTALAVAAVGAGASDCTTLSAAAARGVLGVSAAGAVAPTPAWARLLAVGAQALLLPAASLCTAATAAVAGALASEEDSPAPWASRLSLAATAALAAPQSAYTYSFRVDASAAANNAGSWLLGLQPDAYGMVPSSALSSPALQASLSAPLSWPGASLGVRSAASPSVSAALPPPRLRLRGSSIRHVGAPGAGAVCFRPGWWRGGGAA